MKLSVITINYNNRNGLLGTFESVKNQTYKVFQYVVIDGASTDGSVELLDEYRSIIDVCISEKDGGIFNAMNKGIKYAQGDYCLFLNSGDTLYADNTLERVAPLLGEADFMSGDTACCLVNGETKTWKSPNEISLYLLAIYSLSHQATFIKASLLKERPYREDLKIVSDWEQVFYEIMVRGHSYRRLDLPVCRFTYGGVSSSNPELREIERKKVLGEHLSERMQDDIVHPNLLVRIAVLADYGSRYYKVLELVARVVRKLFKH